MSTSDDSRPAWRWRRGWKAFAICVVCAEGVIAGVARSCMPSFDVGILLGQLLLLNLFGAPVILGAVAGVPALAVAAFPEVPKPGNVWLRALFASVIFVGFLLTAGYRFAPALVPVLWALIGLGLLVGFAMRTLGLLARLWLPSGILAALAAGALVFSFGHYGSNNCWP